MKQLQILTNGKSTKELINIDTHNKILSSIDTYLQELRFNYVVTTDNLKQVKKNNTELNQSIDVIKEFGKKLVDLESEDINTFKSNIKTYWETIEAKRQQRLKDIDIFESETREVLKGLILYYISSEQSRLSIREEFQKVKYDDLIIISHITGKGQLTKACKDKIDIRIQQCKSNQDKYDMRLLQLENICYQNGLESPLTINHIQGIIYESDDNVYNQKLTKLINDELDRVANIKKQIKEDLAIETSNRVKEQISKVRSTFQLAYGMLDIEDLEKHLIRVTDFDVSVFDLCLDTAKHEKESAITKINQALYAKKKALEDTKDAIDTLVSDPYNYNAKIFTTEEKVREINPFDIGMEIIDNHTPNAVSLGNIQIGDIEVKPNYDIDTSSLKEGQKIVLVKTVFKVIIEDGIINDDVIDGVRSALNGADVSDYDIVSIDVLEV